MVRFTDWQRPCRSNPDLAAPLSRKGPQHMRCSMLQPLRTAPRQLPVFVLGAHTPILSSLHVHVPCRWSFPLTTPLKLLRHRRDAAAPPPPPQLAGARWAACARLTLEAAQRAAPPLPTASRTDHRVASFLVLAGRWERGPPWPQPAVAPCTASAHAPLFEPRPQHVRFETTI